MPITMNMHKQSKYTSWIPEVRNEADKYNQAIFKLKTFN